jgi:hypothetical protein
MESLHMPLRPSCSTTSAENLRASDISDDSHDLQGVESDNEDTISNTEKSSTDPHCADREHRG